MKFYAIHEWKDIWSLIVYDLELDVKEIFNLSYTYT
jgi:hypothetical protein